MMPASARGLMRAARSGVGAFCLGVFLLVQTMAAVPALHTWLHQDASAPGHECAVTLFLNGQVHSPTTEVAVAPCAALLFSYAPPRGVDFVSADVRLLPSRGPPA
ncbi:MAG TPA: hypothetical protein VGR14_01230 [Verrucomicrobiae bacterium]|nr:hypothetical protein [Verrucomicrobiae bacterium]